MKWFSLLVLVLSVACNGGPTAPSESSSSSPYRWDIRGLEPFCSATPPPARFDVNKTPLAVRQLTPNEVPGVKAGVLVIWGTDASTERLGALFTPIGPFYGICVWVVQP